MEFVVIGFYLLFMLVAFCLPIVVAIWLFISLRRIQNELSKLRIEVSDALNRLEK